MDEILSAIPVWGLVALGILGVVQITLDVIALLDLYRRPSDQLVFANKWIWVAVILLASTIGPIVYLAAARKPAALTDGSAPPASTAVHTDKVADALYGPRGDRDEPGDTVRR